MLLRYNADSKVHGVNMGTIWGRQDPGGPHIGPMNLLSGKVLGVSLGIGFISEIDKYFSNA